MNDHLVPLGELVSTHGIKGWLRLKPFNPDSPTLTSGRPVLLQKEGAMIPRALQSSKAFKGLFLVKFQGIEDIEEAQKWVGAVVTIEERDLQALESGEYYCYQVMGFDVVDLQGRWIGKISSIWAKAGGDLYRVAGASKEHLIPAAKEIIERVDLANRKVVINPPAGLLDL